MNKALQALKALKDLKCYDISVPLQTNMPMYGGNPNLWIIPNVRTIEKDTYYSQVLVMGEHVGAHIDAPVHTIDGMKYIDEYPGDYFIAPYKKYALDRFDPQPGQFMTLEHFKQLEKEDGFEIEEGDVVLLQYGWHKYYFPDTTDKEKFEWYSKNQPGLNDEAMEYLVSKKIKAIGADDSACAGPFLDGKPFNFKDHKVYFHPNNIPIMEGFGDMTPAPAEGLFVAITMPISKGSGSPVRPLLFG